MRGGNHHVNNPDVPHRLGMFFAVHRMRLTAALAVSVKISLLGRVFPVGLWGLHLQFISGMTP